MIIKQKPEDFVVEEIPLMEYLSTIRNVAQGKEEKIKEGNYAIFKIEKRGMNHFSMIAKLSKHFSVPEKDIGTAGIKDRNAVTKQYVSVLINQKNKNTVLEFPILAKVEIEHADDQKLSAIIVGVAKERITTGLLAGNSFNITIKELDKSESDSINKSLDFYRKNRRYVVPNYFGTQRFGNNNSNAIVGYHILKKEFAKAVREIEAQNSWLPEGHADMDALNALNQVSRKKRMLYVSALQSLLFNLELRKKILGKDALEEVKDIENNDDKIRKLTEIAVQYEYLNEENMQTAIETIGKENEMAVCGFNTNSDSYAAGLLSEIGLTPRDFAIRQMPDLMFDEHPRSAYVRLENLRIIIDTNSKEAETSFYLVKGSYATNAVSQLITFQ